MVALVCGCLLLGSVSSFSQVMNSQLKKNEATTLAKSQTARYASPVSVISAGSTKSLLATSLGAIMGGGALVLYAPIIINLWKAKSGEGMSPQTWLFNLLGIHISLINSRI